MPELPEVETVVRELRDSIVGRKIQSLNVLWERTYTDSCPIPLKNQTIIEIGRQGKYIIVRLEYSHLVIHLRMTGQLLFFQEGNPEPGSHVRLIFRFSDASELHFRDTRKFGRVHHVASTETVLSSVGVDALDDMLTRRRFREMLGRSRMNLKAFLLAQKYISGLGNIYVDESLFRSKLHPARISGRLNIGEMDLLYSNIRDVLHEAVRNMGSTISDYRDTYGNPGGNQMFFRVYGRKGKPCVECGAEIIKIRFAGRGTYVCPECQKAAGM